MSIEKTKELKDLSKDKFPLPVTIAKSIIIRSKFFENDNITLLESELNLYFKDNKINKNDIVKIYYNKVPIIHTEVNNRAVYEMSYSVVLVYEMFDNEDDIKK